MLQNAYFLARIGADRAENEQHFAEILPAPRRRGVEDVHVGRHGRGVRARARHAREGGPGSHLSTLIHRDISCNQG